ncbi:predicted protein [Nematostella vectensis]|uniref:Hexosyltransferase n=1 Tax=Nematostella vectensis TaxID=45351 RepID=A7S807_NEMVE|nr:predicted protein [Nematostella vectensis]|eukprot:XP_001632231.1 predicted protein [Nematostella vectensis]
MMRKRRCKCYLRLVFGCCLALVYIQFQLLPLTGSHRLERLAAMATGDDFMQPINWGNLCADNQTVLKKLPVQTDKLNRFVWKDILGSDVMSILGHPYFPYFASDVHSLSNTSLIKMNSEQNYAQWIIGYIHADKTGVFRFAIASDDSSELRVSTDENPMNARVVAAVGDGAVAGSTLPGDFLKYADQMSGQLYLTKCNRYYFEIIHKQGRGDSFVQVHWKRPGSLMYQPISNEFFSSFAPIADMQTLMNNDVLNDLLDMRREDRIKRHYDASSDYTRKHRLGGALTRELLLKCKNRDSEVLIRDQKKTRKGARVNRVFYAAVGSSSVIDRGEGALAEDAAKEVVSSYLVQLEASHPGKYSLVSITSVESKTDEFQGDRYFIDAIIKALDSEALYRIAEYVYQPYSDPQLYMYTRTRERNIHITVLVYESDKTRQVERDVRYYLDKSQLSQVTSVLRGQGTGTSFEALRSVSTSSRPGEILLVTDNKLQLPFDIFDQTRKHCIMGSAAFSPIAFYLEQGAHARAPVGSWGDLGYDLFAIFKDDWDRIHSNAKRRTGKESELMELILSSDIDVERVMLLGLYKFHDS